MTRRETYLDWNATAPLRPEAVAAVTAALAHVRQSVLGASLRAAPRGSGSSGRARRSRRWSARRRTA